MADLRLEEEEWTLLRALRASQDCTVEQLARALGLPRTNFGRRPGRRLRDAVNRLVALDLVLVQRDRYRLADRGRRALATRALGGSF